MKRKAIILVAGMGTRLKPLTADNHKCLTMVNGTPILINMLDKLSNSGISEVVLVVGYLKEQIRKKIGNQYCGMKILYSENERYTKTNTSYSLQLGLDSLFEYDELYILEGDVFFEESVLNAIVLNPNKNATVLERFNKNLDGTFVTLDEDCNVIDWVHKSKRPDNYNVSDKYKTVNIHKFSHDFVDTFLKPETDNTVYESNGEESMESVMQKIVLCNKLVKGIILNGEKWFEIDDLDDLEKAEKIFRK